MKILTNFSVEQSDNIAVTIGFFDGVHRGHQYIIEQLKKIALQNNLKSAIITFRTHPRKELHSEFVPHLLTSLDEKLELISKTGIDYCFLLDFNADIRNLTAKEFIQNVLAEKLNTKILLMGYDNKIGKGRMEDFEKYVEYGKEKNLEVVQSDEFIFEGKQVSSSEIRRLMSEGDVVIANKLLGYNFKLSGTVVEGQRLGRKIGYPTANLLTKDSEKKIPANGVYSCWVMVDGMRYLGMLNIGHRPTILENPTKETIEVHILNFDRDIYGKNISMEIIKKLRNEQKFPDLKALKKQLDKDKSLTIKVLNNIELAK
ncbi:MAG: bifunctional riboflavin kinase/FAD synthetase [Microbacter sp.]